MSPDLIELTEYRPERVWLDDDDRDHLLRLVRGADEDDRRVFQSITPTSERNVYRVTPGHIVGRLGLPSGRAIDIASRFRFEDTLELIRLAHGGPLRADDLQAPASQKPFLIDVLARAFVGEVERLVSFGLAKGYRAQRFERPPFPGVPDVTTHLARFAARPDKLVTRARRITTDVPVNRAAARALDVLSRLRLDGEIARRLRRAEAPFARTTRLPITAANIEAIPLDRLTARYEVALGLAGLILSGQSLGPADVVRRGTSILFDMSKVWERFVAHWVEASVAPDLEVRQGHGFNVTTDGSVRGYADVSVWDGDRIVGLFDAKYKRLVDRPGNPDIYQMVTYCTRLGSSEATLVYPAPAPRISLTVDTVTIRTIGIDLSDLQTTGGVARVA